MANVGMWTGLEKATGKGLELTGMLINKQREDARMALEERRIADAEKTSLAQRNLAEEQLKDLKYKNDVVDLEDTIEQLGIKTPKAKDWARQQMSLYSQDGLVKNPDGTARKVFQRKYGFQVRDELMKDPKKALELDQATMQDYQDMIGAIQSTIDPEADPNDKKVMAAEAKKAQLIKERDILQNHILEQKHALRKDRLITVPENAKLIDPLTREVIAEGVSKVPPLTDDIKEYNLAVEQGETRNFTEWLRGNKKAGAPRVSIENKVGQDSMTELGKEMSKDLVSQRKDVQGAVSSLNNLKEAERLISGGVITGTGAEYLVNFGNFLSSRMGINLAKTPVENTQAFTATMGNQVGQIIKQFGSGTGLSDADREYAEKIVGGKITLTEGAIKKLMAINKKGYENVVRNYNKRADQAMKKPGADQLPYDLRIEYDFDEKLPAGLKAGW